MDPRFSSEGGSAHQTLFGGRGVTLLLELMKPSLIITILALIFSFSAEGATFADAVVGSQAPDFSVPDTNGNVHTLSNFKGKFVVLEWNNPDCPFVKRHYDSRNMQGLQKEFGGKGVAWLAINSSAPGRQGHYSAEEHNKILAERESQVTALLLDPEGKVGRLYGANTTPHMFIINPDGNLIYNGAIDSDAWAKNPQAEDVENYVEAALNQAIAGQPVSKPTTKPYGCSVKYAS